MYIHVMPHVKNAVTRRETRSEDKQEHVDLSMHIFVCMHVHADMHRYNHSFVFCTRSPPVAGDPGRARAPGVAHCCCGRIWALCATAAGRRSYQARILKSPKVASDVLYWLDGYICTYACNYMWQGYSHVLQKT